MEFTDEAGQGIRESEGENGNAKARNSGRVSLEELMTISKRASMLVVRPYVSHDELLYDENGLPK